MTTRREIIAGVAIAPFVRPSPAGASTSADAELLALRPVWLARRAAFEDVMKRDEDEPGYEEDELRTMRAENEMIDRVAAIPARTLQGLRFKAEVSIKNDHLFEDLVDSIINDLAAFEP